MKRKDYLSWDEYFMGIAKLSAQRSKDPSTQVGACIVDEHKHIVAVGYNGMPCGCHDDDMPWEREGSFLDTKYAYVCHAELNAISNAAANLRGSKMYVTLFPCNECAKLIIQNGIKEVIYLEDKYADTDGVKASKFMFEKAGVKLTDYNKLIEKKSNKSITSDVSFVFFNGERLVLKNEDLISLNVTNIVETNGRVFADLEAEISKKTLFKVYKPFDSNAEEYEGETIGNRLFGNPDIIFVSFVENEENKRYYLNWRESEDVSINKNQKVRFTDNGDISLKVKK